MLNHNAKMKVRRKIKTKTLLPGHGARWALCLLHIMPSSLFFLTVRNCCKLLELSRGALLGRNKGTQALKCSGEGGVDPGTSGRLTGCPGVNHLFK